MESEVVLTDDQLAYLASYYEERLDETPVKATFRTMPKEIRELVAMGLLEPEDLYMPNYTSDTTSVKITAKGIEVVEGYKHKALDLVTVLVNESCYLSAAFFIQWLPKEDLPMFLSHSLVLFRDAARERAEELDR